MGYNLLKKLYFLIFLFIVNTSLLAQNPFVTTWKTTMDNESIVIPTGGGGVDYTVAWGDGNTDSNLSGDATHEYDTAGIYTVSISGDFNRIYFFHMTTVRKYKALSIGEIFNGQP